MPISTWFVEIICVIRTEQIKLKHECRGGRKDFTGRENSKGKDTERKTQTLYRNIQ